MSLMRFGSFCIVILLMVVWAEFGRAEDVSLNSRTKFVENNNVVFSIKNSIEMTEPIDPRSIAFMDDPKKVVFSPAGDKFIILTRQGNVESGKNRYTIMMFNSDEVLDYVNSDGQTDRPSGKIIYKLDSSDYAHVYDTTQALGIQKIRWLEGGAFISFLAKDNNSFNQVHLYEVASSSVRKLTSASLFIEDYDLSVKNNILVFVARSERKCNLAFPYPEKIGTGSFFEHIGVCNHPDLAFNWPFAQLGLFRTNIDGDNSIDNITTSIAYSNMGYNLSISPDGRRLAFSAGVVPMPSWERYYQNTAEERHFWNFISGNADNNLVGEPFPVLRQAHVVNLENNSVEVLLDAPLVYGEKYAGVLWSPDSSKVIIIGTQMQYLPDSTSNRFSTGAHIAVVDIVSKASRSIYQYDTPFGWGADSRRLADSAVLMDGHLIVTEEENDGRGRVKTDKKCIRIRKNILTDSKNHVKYDECKDYRRGRLSIVVKEGYNNPPEYYAEDLRSGSVKQITDLNPSFYEFEQPHIEYFVWLGKKKEKWAGALILPPNFRSDLFYPLVVQIGSQNQNRFIRDGSEVELTAPFAGRALASNDIVVLNMPAHSLDSRAVKDAGETLGKGHHFSDGIEAALEGLAERGISIDRRRIGLIGFSHGGRTALNALVQSRIDFRAAVIADAAPVGPLAYYLAAGWTYDLAGMIEGFVEGYPWGEGLLNWNRNNPVLQLDRINAAIRIENYLRPAAVVWYDVYTVMRRLGKAVEYYTYDGSTHVPLNPVQRFSSQQGTVDWMLFWLMDESERTKAMEPRFTDWEKMRILHDSAISGTKNSYGTSDAPDEQHR